MTKEFEHLTERLNEINQTFDNLLKDVDPLLQSNTNYQDIIKSYILLCHAEFERYFEDVSESIMKHSYDLYEKTIITKPLLYLVLMNDRKFEKEDKDNTTDSDPLNYKNIVMPEDRLKKIYSNYRALLVANHGIKKDNLFKMLTPLGFEFEKLDETYIINMNNFGKKRGEIAHKGDISISTNYNYQQEQLYIKGLLASTLSQVDNKLVSLLDE